jgi:hypothetical protein
VKFIINDQVIKLRTPEGPLVPHIASFLTWASGQGYALRSLRRRIRVGRRWDTTNLPRLVSADRPARTVRSSWAASPR